MFTLRSLTSKIPNKTSCIHNKSLLPSITSSLQSLSSSSSSFFSTETGTVKFYQIGKAYGFITADSDQTDLFVHRTNIAGAPEDDNMNPVLKAGERMMFQRKKREGAGSDGDKFEAVEVVYENGERVPVFRDGVCLFYEFTTL